MAVDVVIVDSVSASIITIPDQNIVTTIDPSTTIVTEGIQGPSGPRGIAGPSGGSAVTVNAGMILSGHMAVRLDASGNAVYVSNTVLSDAGFLLGMTAGAALLGAVVDVIAKGEVTEPTWNWVPGLPIYVGANGILTQTPPSFPSALFMQVIGFPMTPTKVFISPREPINLV